MAQDTEPLTRVTYDLDHEMAIVAVGGDWDAFARDNGAPGLSAPAPLGRSLRSFISDRTTAHLYDVIFARVRASGEPLTIPFRCDGPHVRRRFELTVSRTPGGFSVHSNMVASEPRAPVPFPITPGSGGEMIRSCGWCKRIAVDGAWVEIEEAVAILSLFHGPALPDVSHGICDACLERMEGLVDAA